MTGPFIFIATNRLKPGKLEAERARVGELADYIAEAEPRLIAFNEFADENGAEVDSRSRAMHSRICGSGSGCNSNINTPCCQHVRPRNGLLHR